MATGTPYFLPAVIGPIQPQKETRIPILREALRDPLYERQRKNILFVIHLYETGELPGTVYRRVWIQDGKIVEPWPKNRGEVPVWVEVCPTFILILLCLLNG